MAQLTFEKKKPHFTHNFEILWWYELGDELIAISKDLYKQSGYKGSPETQIILARTSMAMYILWLGGAVLVDLALALALSYNLKRSGFGGFKS